MPSQGNISAKLLQADADILKLTESINYLISLSFSNPIIPDQLKLAKVIHFFIIKVKCNPDSYRQIKTP